MNKLEFNIIHISYQTWQPECAAVQILIDGVDLIEMLKIIERPFALNEDQEDKAGSYAVMELEYLYKHLGRDYLIENGKAEILQCTCGCEGCWDFMTEVKEVDDKVIWTNFENNHRGRENKIFWDYSSVNDFVFDKHQYEQELAKLKAYMNK
jgi:hypothetical protein